MLNIYKLFVDGLMLSILTSIVIVVMLWINPRIMLQDYPKDIQALAPQNTKGKATFDTDRDSLSDAPSGFSIFLHPGI